MQHAILACGSTGDPYTVQFTRAAERVTIRCSCPAGALRQLYKHKNSFLVGDASMLFDADQEPDLNEALSWLRIAAIPAVLAQLEERLAEIERERKARDRKAKALKSEFARLLSGA